MRIAAWRSAPSLVELTLNPPPAPTGPSVDDFRRAVQVHLDAKAQERQYDDTFTLATYVISTNPDWAAEAQAFAPGTGPRAGNEGSGILDWTDVKLIGAVLGGSAIAYTVAGLLAMSGDRLARRLMQLIDNGRLPLNGNRS
ncbi:hypothetical protein [Nitratireductor sp. GCM10026969]|uniref:hypothetical protein n=1 Tax=Nitratireductor sp. GCM10026969 TaxID=3252645 RepID=UPI0036203021